MQVFSACVGRLLDRGNRDGDCVQFLVLSIFLGLPLEFLVIPRVVEIKPELSVENIFDLVGSGVGMLGFELDKSLSSELPNSREIGGCLVKSFNQKSPLKGRGERPGVAYLKLKRADNLRGVR